MMQVPQPKKNLRRHKSYHLWTEDLSMPIFDHVTLEVTTVVEIKYHEYVPVAHISHLTSPQHCTWETQKTATDEGVYDDFDCCGEPQAPLFSQKDPHTTTGHTYG
eukprot:m.151026 g.151026  ORF g.151026 m.151026 type:complete len:105 (-) comp23346_c0_seq3:1442-1756(-)